MKRGIFLKILHLISSMGYFGAENVVFELARNTNDNSNHAIIGVINNPRNPHLELYETSVENGVPSVVFPCVGRFDLKTIFAIREFILEQNIDIIHCHGYKSNIYGLTASVFTGVARIATVHNWIKTDYKLIIYSILDKLLLRYFDSVIAVSEAIKNEIQGCLISKRKVSILRNGVNLGRFKQAVADNSIRDEFGFSANERIIGSVGRLSEEKGHLNLIKAAKAVIELVPEAKFIIIGDGPLRSSLEQMSKSLGIGNNVVFTGLRKDIPGLLSMLDVFALPSLDEGMPMSLLEAMASGKCVVATKVGDVPKVIINELTGILVEPGDIVGLKEAIISVLRDKKKAAYLSQNGYRKIVNEYSSKSMCREYIGLYFRVLDK